MPTSPPALDSTEMLLRLQFFMHLLTERERRVMPCAWAFWHAEHEREQATRFLALEAASEASSRARCWHIARCQEKATEQAARGEQLRAELSPEEAGLLDGGGRAFLEAARDRLVREHRWEFVNPCPRCGGTTRTVRARQCPHCFYDWH